MQSRDVGVADTDVEVASVVAANGIVVENNSESFPIGDPWRRVYCLCCLFGCDLASILSSSIESSSEGVHAA